MRLVRLARQPSRVADDVRAALASLGRGNTVVGGVALIGAQPIGERVLEAVVVLPTGVLVVIGVDLPDPALRLEAPLGAAWVADGWPLVGDDEAVNPATEALDLSQACERRIAEAAPGAGPVGTIIAVGPFVETVDQPPADLAGPVRVLHPTPTTMLAATVSLATRRRPRSIEQARTLIAALAPDAPEFSDDVLLGEGFARFTDDAPPGEGPLGMAAPPSPRPVPAPTTAPHPPFASTPPPPSPTPPSPAPPPFAPSSPTPPSLAPSSPAAPEPAVPERPNVALGASDAPNVAFGASDAPNATLGRLATDDPVAAEPPDDTEPPAEAEIPAAPSALFGRPVETPAPQAEEPWRPSPRPRTVVAAGREEASRSRIVRWLPLAAIALLVVLVVAAIVIASGGSSDDAAPSSTPPTPASSPPPNPATSAAPVTSLQFTPRASASDQRCASHAFGDVQVSLQRTSCSGVRRASYLAQVDGRTAAVTIGIVEFPDSAQAVDFKSVADTPGGGGILDLASETGQWPGRPPSFDGAAFRSKLDGKSVRLVEAAWAPGPSTPDDAGLVRAATAALDLPVA